MREVIYSLPGIAITVFCWGIYGSVLHIGQAGLGQNKLKPLICVGLAYFVVAIIIPSAILVTRGEFFGQWSFTGISWSMAAGVAGALGALGIILALTSGGKPAYVMPLVFGCAPIVNVFATMALQRIPLHHFSPFFLAGLFMVALGAALVLIFKPGVPHATKPTAVKKSVEQVKPEPGRERTERTKG